MARSEDQTERKALPSQCREDVAQACLGLLHKLSEPLSAIAMNIDSGGRLHKAVEWAKLGEFLESSQTQVVRSSKSPAGFVTCCAVKRVDDILPATAAAAFASPQVREIRRAFLRGCGLRPKPPKTIAIAPFPPPG